MNSRCRQLRGRDEPAAPRGFWSRVQGFCAFALAAALAPPLVGCETLDAGPNFVLASESFDADFFYCQVEPHVLMAKKCGSGDPSDRAGGCHFNASAVSGMALTDHAAIACDASNHPNSRAELGAGSAAAANFESASLVMSRDLVTAPIYVRPLGAAHPRAIFSDNDPVVAILRDWSQR